MLGGRPCYVLARARLVRLKDADIVEQRNNRIRRRDMLAAAGAWAALDSAGQLEAATGAPRNGTPATSDDGLRGHVDKLGSSAGGEMIATSRGNSVERELTWTRATSPASIDEFYSASNGIAAERMALEAALASGRAVSFRGLLTLDRPIVMT